jgi:arsenite-transporting ATPase
MLLLNEMTSDEVISTEKSQRPVLLVGGKGGVGKTTCSAAIAAHSAAIGLKTLIITSDLSPSLSDIFEQTIGDTITEVTKNLDAYEISQEAIVTWWRQRFGRDFTDILAHLIDVDALDSESRHQLLDYIGSAPSLREETMLDVIRDMAENRGYDRIVWDTAPAGETLNLLDMPRNIRKHIRAGAKVFEGLDRIGKQLLGKRSIAGIMDGWIEVSEQIARFIREKSSFLIVAIPEALVVKQVARMITTLEEYQLPIHGLIVNCVVEVADSPSLVAVQDMQSPYLRQLRRMAETHHVATLPRSFTEIRGIERLQKIGAELATRLAL